MRYCSLLLPLAVFLAGAEDPPDPPEVPAGHSAHGEAFNEGPRQRAWLMGSTGDVHLEITTDSAEVQEFFDQGIGQLHGFWYLEAERSFRHAAALQPGCAMAYWGMAMANVNNSERAKDFIAKAQERVDGVSDRERLWIESLHRYYHGSEKDRKKRSRQFIRDLESLVFEDPEDPEAKAFLAWAIYHYRSQHPIGSHLAVSSLMEEVFQASPMHPAHHYRIHLWDYEKPGRALASAALCGQSAPGIAHMWHMPGHIYSRLHRYADAAWQQEASARVDHAHMMRTWLLPDQIFNYSHNNEWLIRNLNHLGRARDAVDLARNMIELPRHPRYNTLKRRNSSSSYGRRRLIETLVRFELWDSLLEHAGTVYLEPSEQESDIVSRQTALGLAAWQLGDGERLVAERRPLEDLLEKKRKQRIDAGDKAEAEAVEENKSEEDVAKAMVDAMRPFGRSIASLRGALARFDLYQALHDGRHEDARGHLDRSKGLSSLEKARVRLVLGDEDEAVELIRSQAERSPGQVAVTGALVEILMQTGRTDEAADSFEDLRGIAAHMDQDLPLYRRLSALSCELGHTGDWRKPAVAASDVGVRPDLEGLGPFRWSPWEAPAWTLQGADAGPVRLADYRGRPLLMVFYLGYGCAHCVEQLAALSPRAGDFALQDISIVAISTETPAQLEESFQKSEMLEKMPFPILSNHSLDIFRLYRAFDDFEGVPMHGTFLVGPDGAVRWQDISYEPFEDVAFLLEESRRLLGQGGAKVALGLGSGS